MRHDLAVSFETFYYFNLLEKIRELGRNTLDNSELNYLEHFLDYLFDLESASNSIERLSQFKSTSDLSIFFSDILEHLNRIDHDSAMQEVNTYSRDFLEMFGILSKDEEWKSHLENVTGLKISPELSSTDDLSRALSFAEYCNHVIGLKINSYAQKLSSEHQSLFRDFLYGVLKSPSSVNNVHQRIQSQKVNEFIDLSNSVFTEQEDAGNTNDYIQDFENRIDKWLALFEEVLHEETEEIKEMLSVGAVEERAEPSEDAEKLFEEVGEERTESDIDELVDRMGTLRQKAEAVALSEEEQERRKLLQDYIIGEIDFYKEELYSLLQRLSDGNHDIESENKLLENLKFFKDLGQIHSYFGIEFVGKNLLRLFEGMFRNNIDISQEMLQGVEGIFHMLPEYVRSSISVENKKHISAIEKQLTDLGSIIGDEENITLHHEETLKETFHEIIARKIKMLKQKLDKQSVKLWGEDDISEISSTLNNIIFWSNILKLNQVAKAISVLKQLLLTSRRQTLSEKDLASISEFMEFMDEGYASADEDLWDSTTKKLQAILSPLEFVPVTEAKNAFEDVTIQQIARLVKAINNSQIQSEELFKNVIPHFFRQLNENATFVENESIKSAAQEAIDIVKNINQHISVMESTERERFEYFLEGILEQFRKSSYPIVFRELLKYLKDLQTRLESGKEAAAETGFEQVQEKAEGISEDEIQTVFQKEAHKYIERIEDTITQLESEYNEESWQQMGATVHTLKGSAQMLGRRDVSQLATMLEEIAGRIQKANAPNEGEIFRVIKDVVESIKMSVENPSYYSDDIPEQLQNRIQNLSDIEEVEQESGVTTEEEIPHEAEFLSENELTTKEDDQEIIELVEQDPEMLEIFNEEVSNNIELVERHLDNIERFAYDKALMQEVDRSVHEVCSAAKMLGLTEIGHLSEKLEQLVDLIYQQKFTDVKGAIPLMRRAMLVIRELTSNRQIEQHFYEEVSGEIASILEGDVRQDVPQERPEQPAIKEELPEGLTPQVWEAFFQEAAELIDDINYLILELEKSPDNKELRHHLMRSLHNLKGSAGMVYADKIETLAHSSEGVLEKFAHQNLSLDARIFNLLFEVVDETKYILNALKTFQQEETQKFDEIREKLSQYGEGEGMKVEEAESESLISESQEVEPPPHKEETEKKAKEAPPAEKTYIRLNIDQMNHLLNLAAEIVISHTQFKNQLDRLKNMTPALDSELKLFEETKEHLDSIFKLEQKIQDTLSPIEEVQPGIKESVKNQLVNISKILAKFQAFQQEIDSLSHSLRDNSETYEENIQKLNKLSNELLDEIIQARLVPIHLLFKRFYRPVRDIAQQFNKKINLVIKGEDTELDRSLVEDLYNPLIHIIRNAIDHGIETPKEREAVGKDPEGLLEIEASRDRNQVNIEIHDDGSGIDLENVKKSALEKELISQKDLETRSEQDVFDLLFYPGFSTLPEATRVSGRGVGLDAVKTEIERIKGDIRIYSEKGKGTTFVIRVPISLSVIQSMLVNVKGHVYSIPLNQVEETLNIEAKDIMKKGEDYFFRYKAKEIPLVFLSRLLVLQHEVGEAEISLQNTNPVIITFDRGNYVALLVDRIVRREEILIKSLGPSLKRLKYIIGGSIMADGRIVLVLDIPQIIQETLKTSVAATQAERPTVAKPRPDTKKMHTPKKKGAQRVIEDRKPTILIVDDSLSIRKYVSGLLSEWGFIVDAAKNGYEALKLLKSKDYDLMITDLEMPQISGYELIESARNDIKLQDIPIIVLTGRASEDFRRLTNELGADAYIIKPFKDQELLDEINKFIHYGKE